jgi:hypothetical protein
MKLLLQRFLVNVFEQARPAEFSMNLDGGVNDYFTEFIFCRGAFFTQRRNGAKTQENFCRKIALSCVLAF